MRTMRLRVAVAAMSVLAGACSGPASDTTAAREPPAPEQPRQGGTILISIGEPVCADWYGQCGAGSLGVIPLQTLPSPMSFVGGKYVPTPLLIGEPTVDQGPPQRVTYRIDPRAAWSDGMPITSADFRYSWEQGRPTNVRGMGDIAAIDDSDPKTAVVTWKEPNAAWRERFRPILPRHLLEGKDRNAEMKDGYRFSGGPWVIDHWTRGQELKIVRNPRYWGPPAHLDAVVLRVITDPTAVRQAYKSNQIDMFLQAGAEPGIEEMQNLADTGFADVPALNYSFLAFNTQSPPLDRKAVRHALAYATDRDAIVTQLQGHLRPGVRPIHSLASRAVPDFYSEPFTRYRRDLTKVAELMQSDGWSKGTDGVWARADMRARIDLLVDSAPRFHLLFSQIIESQWKEAGFEVTVQRAPAATINVDLLPKGNYQVAFTGAGISSDPGQCVRFCSRYIPTETSRFVGANTTRITSQVLDDLWGRADTELDPSRRRDLARMAQEALSDELPALPIASIIDVYVFNNRKIGGPVSVGPGVPALHEWFCRTTCG